MVIVIDDEKVMRCARRISLSLVALAVLLFLVLSGMVFKFSTEHALEYEMKYNMMNASGKAVASSMRKTGEVEDSLLNNKNAFRNTKKNGKNNAFFDEVSRKHRNDR
ncbi:hypothetical protein [Treponema saccharophilum]|uniref:Uncharacterized protein n=1 Tax=Treponema saccharophilum DSM 2985 TaxID=907348 RepID=H7ELQ2_9SPIR|nr:hypothetical protein [Treponema saccharophilum]EIC01593.1 hypothetical protein TresaDRAFT_1202 [Treponema saccharophilum DSM 2985]BDC95501.1 hypothetical protein TRSA_06000 [Treponema saccharophilum]